MADHDHDPSVAGVCPVSGEGQAEEYGPGGGPCTCGHGDPCYDCNLGADN